MTEDKGEMFIDMSDGIRRKITDMNKQDKLVSGTNIKTINNQSILGSGNIIIEGGAVDDVKINGASIVENGVANIPIGSLDKPGVVGYAEEYGTHLYEGYKIGISVPDDNQIKNRSGHSLALLTKNYDLAVKCAICDGKGAAWTADEQAAARDRMGILIDQTYTPDSTNAQSGIAVKQALENKTQVQFVFWEETD